MDSRRVCHEISGRAQRDGRALCRLVMLACWLGACSSDQGSQTGAQQAAAGGATAAVSGSPAPQAGANPSMNASAGRSPTPSGGAAAVPASGGAAAVPGSAGRVSAAGSGGALATGTGGTAAAAAGSGGATSAGSGATAAAGGDCSRDGLKANVDAILASLKAHDTAGLPLADNVKYTENGKMVNVGEGFWKTAGDTKLKRSALDTETCSSVTESVITENSTDIVLGLRLKAAAGKLSEIEAIIVRKGDYSSNPMALLGTASDDWETVLPADMRAKREQLQMIVEKYFSQFPAGACNFASDCKRFENGFSPGGCSLGLSCSMSSSMGRSGMMTRLAVHDVDAGIAVGFTMFAGQYTDFHMFKVRGGEVHGVHAVLAKASSPGW